MEIPRMQPVPWKKVRVTGGFWKQKLETNRKITIPSIYRQLEETGRIQSLDLNWKPGMPHKPHPYWDSDIAKWIEAASYSLAVCPNDELEKKIDFLVDKYGQNQWPDGYLNTYFTAVEPEKRWTNVYVMHEMYCGGHLLEAAIAYYQATGKGKFLEILTRFIEHVSTRFGRETGKIRGYPGHQELELALVKLYRLTGEKKYVDLSSYFVNERGTQPYFFELEAIKRGEDPNHSPYKEILNKDYLPAGPYALFQAHAPVREQKTAEGHAVRAMYLYSAMADLAKELPDDTLRIACETLWKDVTRRKMYITGGIGSLEVSERFTFPYDLPNETAYNETCASIGLVFWAHRMLHLTGKKEYADTLERALYNGVLSGVSLSGDHFFYCNHLAVEWQVYHNRVLRNPRLWPARKPWFEVSCCPPNVARLLASLGQYAYSQDDENVWVHLYMESIAEISLTGGNVRLTQSTEYPWKGDVVFRFGMEKPCSFGLCLRIPGWCPSFTLTLNGVSLTEQPGPDGYVRLIRTWFPQDILTLTMEIPIRMVESHPYVRMNAMRVAIQRGPLVYCLEEEDCGPHLETMAVPANSELAGEYEPDTLGGVVVIKGEGMQKNVEDWGDDLYRTTPSHWMPAPLRAIPYYAWGNRSQGNMRVWIPVR